MPITDTPAAEIIPCDVIKKSILSYNEDSFATKLRDCIHNSSKIDIPPDRPLTISQCASEGKFHIRLRPCGCPNKRPFTWFGRGHTEWPPKPTHDRQTDGLTDTAVIGNNRLHHMHLPSSCFICIACYFDSLILFRSWCDCKFLISVVSGPRHRWRDSFAAARH